MSQTQTATKRRGFQDVSAQRLPTLVCTGYVSKIGEGKESSTGKYNVNPIEISGYGGSRNTRVNFLSRPDWFASEDGYALFRPATLEKMEGGNSILFVYRKNVKAGEGDSPSVLQGLAVTEENFEELSVAMLSAPGIDGDESAQVIEQVLKDFLIAKDGQEPTEIGYILKQKSVKSDEVDEEGKPVYILENKYEVDSWWAPTAKNKKRYLAIAEKSAAKAQEEGRPVSFKTTFEVGSTV